VVLNALDARTRGAAILTRTRCVRLTAEDGAWLATLTSGDETRCVRARAVVNAAGPWVDRFLSEATPVRAVHQVRLVKGSHVLVPRLFSHRFAYIFQNEDRRIVFAIPYEHEFTLLGTTDVDYHGDPSAVRIDEEELRYLCELANRYFTRQTGARDVRWSYSGVRPLLADESRDPMSVTRDYALELRRRPAPLLSVFGGKITTYRRLAEDAVDLLCPLLGTRADPWTVGARLPGGDVPEGSFAVFLRTVERRYPWLPPRLHQRYAHAYGTRIERVLGTASGTTDLGVELLPGLYEREVEYLCREEFARTAEDVLWRRTKLGLHLPGADPAPLEDWLAAHDRRARAGGASATPAM
jgi:glycerol-3-phosphate dehydrogenase